MTHADTVAGPVGPPGPSVPPEPTADRAPPAPTEPTELVRRHRGRVLRLATRLTGNRSDAEDLTQEVFVRALTAGDTLRPDAVEGWLHRVTTNLFLDHARRRARVRVDPWGEHLEARVRPAAAADVPLLGATFESDVEAALEALVAGRARRRRAGRPGGPELRRGSLRAGPQGRHGPLAPAPGPLPAAARAGPP